MAFNQGWGGRRFQQVRNVARSGGTGRTGGTSGGGGGAPRGFWPGSVFGGGNTLGQRRAVDGVSGTSPAPVDPTIPPMPTEIPPEGWAWVWNGTYWALTQNVDAEAEAKETQNKENALAYLQGILIQYGLEDPDLLDFARQAVEQGWDPTRFINELRNHPAYLKNPLFAANMENAAKGRGFMPEGQLIAYKNEVKRLAKQFGFEAPSDNYIAEGLRNGKSLAEFEHILGIQRRIQEFGEPVRRYAEEWLGVQLGDQDLFEIFSDEHDTADFDRAFKLAQYQGRPIMLGFAGRSAEEARAYEMLGLNPDEVFSRFESARGIKFRTERLSLIEGDIIGNMDRNALQQILQGHEDLVVRASVLQDPRAQTELQALLMREAARWSQGGGAVSGQGGQQIGLLTSAERQSFG